MLRIWGALAIRAQHPDDAPLQIALGIGAVKIAAEDLAASSAVGMFVAFGVYGLALIACSRLAKPPQ